MRLGYPDLACNILKRKSDGEAQIVKLTGESVSELS